MHTAAREAVNTLNSLLLRYQDINDNQCHIHEKNMLIANKTTARASLVSCIMRFQRQNTKNLYIQLRIL